jgi:hypothetical protein
LSGVGLSGDFAFQRPSPQGSVELIVESARAVFTRYLNNRKVAPKNVFVFRSGASDGEFSHIKEYEVHGLQKVISEVFGGTSKLIYVVCNRMHNVRLTPCQIKGTKASEQNLKPGVVVDHTIVHPNLPEFYLIGHLAQQVRYFGFMNDLSTSLGHYQGSALHCAGQ